MLSTFWISSYLLAFGLASFLLGILLVWKPWQKQTARHQVSEVCQPFWKYLYAAPFSNRVIYHLLKDAVAAYRKAGGEQAYPAELLPVEYFDLPTAEHHSVWEKEARRQWEEILETMEKGFLAGAVLTRGDLGADKIGDLIDLRNQAMMLFGRYLDRMVL